MESLLPPKKQLRNGETRTILKEADQKNARIKADYLKARGRCLRAFQIPVIPEVKQHSTWSQSWTVGLELRQISEGAGARPITVY